MNTLLSRYNVNIATPIGDRPLITAINMWLAQYINDHYELSEANRLLSGIDKVLNGQISEGGGVTQSLQYAVVESQDTKIYKDVDDFMDNPSITPDLCITYG